MTAVRGMVMASVGNSETLTLRAEDAEDLAVIASCLQDAVTRSDAFHYENRQRCFAFVANRFRWETEGQRPGVIGRRIHERVQTAVHFEDVLSVHRRNFPDPSRDAEDPRSILELLTILTEPRADGMATVRLIFANDVEVKLEVECINVLLKDLGASWPTRVKPSHPVEETG